MTANFDPNLEMSPKQLGAWGEEQARLFLEKQGCLILSRNYRVHLSSGEKRSRGRIVAEIDLIVLHEGNLVFVEVKTRQRLSCGYPQEAVTALKQKKIRLAAQSFLQEQHGRIRYRSLRFDVIAITGSPRNFHIEHFLNAF